MEVHNPGPDYELAEIVRLSSPAQFKALGHPLRHKLLTLLNERAATTGQLAAALDAVKGTIGHHLEVLERAGLVRVVRTRKVRGGTERYYGRTARAFDLIEGSSTDSGLLLRLAAGEMAQPSPGASDHLVQLRHTRLPLEEAEALAKRLAALADTVEVPGTPAQPIYGFLVGLYRADLPTFPEQR